jgi:hypothetical protein
MPLIERGVLRMRGAQRWAPAAAIEETEATVASLVSLVVRADAALLPDAKPEEAFLPPDTAILCQRPSG